MFEKIKASELDESGFRKIGSAESNSFFLFTAMFGEPDKHGNWNLVFLDGEERHHCLIELEQSHFGYEIYSTNIRPLVLIEECSRAYRRGHQPTRRRKKNNKKAA